MKKQAVNVGFSFCLLNLSRYLARQKYLMHYIYFAFENCFAYVGRFVVTLLLLTWRPLHFLHYLGSCIPTYFVFILSPSRLVIHSLLWKPSLNIVS